MASEPGGRADKLGNEFERLWAVRHLIELIVGTAISFRLEALGDDEKGTEFWVGRPDRSREAHQCKRENGAAGRWTVADLESKQVLSSAKYQLNRDPLHRFVFASADKASLLSDLAERTERCDSPVEFVEHLAATSKELKKEFGALCRCLGFDPKTSEGAAQARDFLRRFRPEVVDKSRLRQRVEELSARWITGEPEDVVAALKDLLDKSIGKTLREPDVIASLPKGSRPRDLAKDPTLRSALEDLRARFKRSYGHLLIGGRPLGRKETADLVAMLTAEDGPRLVLLHGSGGDGKSGVAFEALEQLQSRGILCLPLRLDRDRPDDSPHKFGISLGLSSSPANCLAAAAEGEAGVVVLDQVDAIRWTAAHSSHAWDTCERIISEALRHDNLRAVVVCRSFDLEDDPRIKAWEKANRAIRLKVEALDDLALNTAISSLGVPHASVDVQQRKILRSPQALYLWLALHEGDEHPPAFRTVTDLMRAFWDMTRRRLTELKSGQYEAAIEALVSHMDRRGTLSAPRTVVARWPEEVAALVSLNVLVEGPGRRLLFVHQSFLDYLAAVRILEQVHAGEGTVLGWLAENDQSLFRRGQLRQLLTMLRDDDPQHFLGSMKDLLNGNGVRFHLQHLAIQLLGNSKEPTDEEVQLVTGLLERTEWVDHVYFQVLAGREAWFDALFRRGVLRRWLEDPDERKVKLAVLVAERVIETRGVAVEGLFLDRGQQRWPGRLIHVIWRTPLEKLTSGLFDAALELRRHGEWSAHDFVDWKSLAQVSAARCLRLLETRISRELDEIEKPIGDETTRHFDRDDNSMLVELSSLTSSAASMPTEAWDRLVPCYVRASRLVSRSRHRWRRRSGRNPLSHSLTESARHITRILREVLIAAGKAMAHESPQVFWERAGSESCAVRPIQRVIDRCVPGGPDDWADVAIRRLLNDPSRFRSGRGDRGSVYRPARRFLRRYSGSCSDELFAELQAAVLAHWPLEERSSYREFHDRACRERFWGPLGFDVLKCNDLGLGQYLLLSGLPRTRLSPEAQDRLGVFRRKFGATKPLLKGAPRGWSGCVGSPIPDDRLHKVSDRNWLQIIRRDWSTRSSYPRLMGPGRLGEASVESFARDLGRIAALQPARFARLALRIPIDCDPRYPVAVLHALAARDPQVGTVEEHAGQRPTTRQIEAVIHRFTSLEGDREFAMAVCRAIEHQHDALWSDETITLLSRLATLHRDPQPDSPAASHPRNWDGDGESGGGSDVVVLSINCVRGAAADAIGAVLFDHPERLGVFQPAIDSLVADPHAAVRAAACGVALPLYNIDRGAAVENFLKVCSHQNDEVLRAHHLQRFLRYTILDFFDRLRPLIKRMVTSSIGEVAKTGAAWAAVAWTHRNVMDDIVSDCADGTLWQRKGVAEAVSSAVARGGCHPAVVDRLRSLFDDPEKEVRDAAASIFRATELPEQPTAVALAEAFILSRALDDNIDDLLYGLESFTRSLKPYASVICSLADRFAGPLATEARDFRTSRPVEAGLLAKVLLRLYEQCEDDRTLRQKCLDAWDGLLREGVGHNVLQNVDE